MGKMTLDPNAQSYANLNELDSTAATKLAGIEDNAKDDQSGSEIKAAYEAEAGAYTDTKDTKLSGIEDGAKDDQSGAEIKTAYEAEANAYTDTKDTKLAGIEAGAKDDQDGDEIAAAINAGTDPITREGALSQADLKLVKSEPASGQNAINYIVRKSDGKLEADYNDTPEP